jgi:hypothetical protein
MNDPFLTNDYFFWGTTIVLFIALVLAIGQYDHKKRQKK